MLSIPGNELWLCDGPSRREFLRIGGAAMMGISLPQILALEARAKAEGATGQSSASFRKAKPAEEPPVTDPDAADAGFEPARDPTGLSHHPV